MTRRQSLKAALKRAHSGEGDLQYALTLLDGCPVGGWPDTEQAKRQILELLPLRELRGYTLEQFIDAAYTVDHADRYRSRSSEVRR